LRQRVWLLAVIKTKSSLTSNHSLPPQRWAGMSGSHSAGFGVMMAGRQGGFVETAVARCLVSAMIALAALAPPALAQVNIDQGKAPGQMYDSDCAACHKSIRGLANGRSSSALASFLAEHYTSSSKEAASLAAYVLGSGGGVGTPAATHPPKLKPDTTSASAEEPKDREPKEREAKRPGKPDVPAKPDAKPDVKPDGQQGAGPKPQRPTSAGTKPDGEQQTAVAEPGKPIPGRREPNTGTAARTRGQTTPPAAPKPITVMIAPSPRQTPTPAVSPTPSEPAELLPGAEAPVPRDNIPD
jgi:hypothetical protein